MWVNNVEFYVPSIWLIVAYLTDKVLDQKTSEYFKDVKQVWQLHQAFALMEGDGLGTVGIGHIDWDVPAFSFEFVTPMSNVKQILWKNDGYYPIGSQNWIPNFHVLIWYENYVEEKESI
jgi:hypothetical protein